MVIDSRLHICAMHLDVQNITCLGQALADIHAREHAISTWQKLWTSKSDHTLGHTRQSAAATANPAALLLATLKFAVYHSPNSISKGQHSAKQCSAGQHTIKEGGPSLLSKLGQVGCSAGLAAGLWGSPQAGPKGGRLGG